MPSKILQDGSILIKHFSYRYPSVSNPEWVVVNLVFEPLDSLAKLSIKHSASNYEKGIAVQDVEKYEEALSGMSIKDTPVGKNGRSPLEFDYSKGEPKDFFNVEPNVRKEASISELTAFPGVYVFREYCINNLVVQGAIQQMRLLYEFGDSQDSHFLSIATFTTTLETLNQHWH